MWGGPEDPGPWVGPFVRSTGYRDVLIGGLLLAAGLRGRPAAGWFLAWVGADVVDLAGSYVNVDRDDQRATGSRAGRSGGGVQRAGVRGLQRGGRRHRQIKMQHLRVRAVRPGRLRQLRDLLERNLPTTRRVSQDESVLSAGVQLAGRRSFVAGAVPEPQEFPIELGEPPRVRAVQHDLAQ